MIKSFLETLTNEVKSSKEAIKAKEKNLLVNEQLLLQLDKRPCKDFETSSNIYQYAMGYLYIDLYYEVLAIPDLLPSLEFFEHVLGGIFESYDREDGTRIFKIYSEMLNTQLQLHVTPQESLEATCRKVLIGENVEKTTERTPIYKIVCDGDVNV